MACMMVCLDLYTIDAWLALATQRKVMHKSCYRRAWRQYQALPEAQRRPLEDAIMAPWTAHTVPAPAPVLAPPLALTAPPVLAGPALGLRLALDVTMPPAAPLRVPGSATASPMSVSSAGAAGAAAGPAGPAPSMTLSSSSLAAMLGHAPVSSSLSGRPRAFSERHLGDRPGTASSSGGDDAAPFSAAPSPTGRAVFAPSAAQRASPVRAFSATVSSSVSSSSAAWAAPAPRVVLILLRRRTVVDDMALAAIPVELRRVQVRI